MFSSSLYYSSNLLILVLIQKTLYFLSFFSCMMLRRWLFGECDFIELISLPSFYWPYWEYVDSESPEGK